MKLLGLPKNITSVVGRIKTIPLQSLLMAKRSDLRHTSTINRPLVLDTHALNSYAIFRKLPKFAKSDIIYFYSNPKSYLILFILLYELVFGLAPLSASWCFLEYFPLDNATSDVLQQSISTDMLQNHKMTITEILKRSVDSYITTETVTTPVDLESLKQGINAMIINSWLYPLRVGFSFLSARKFNQFLFGKYLSKSAAKEMLKSSDGEVWNTELNSKIKFKKVNNRRL